MKTRFRIPVMLLLTAMLCMTVVISCKDDDDGDTPPAPVVADVTALKASITAAGTVLSGTEEGKNDGQFPVGSQTALQTAVTSAQAVVDNTATTQAQADAAKVSLDAAVTTYQGLKITPIAADALVAHWSFDEGAGTDVNDASTNGFDGTLKAGPVAPDWESNLPTWSADRNGTAGKALNFNGGSVEVPYNQALNPAAAITVSAWVKSDVTKAKNRFLGLHSWVGYKYELEDRSYPFFSWGYDGGTRDRDANTAVPEGEWHHLVVTFSAADAEMIFYIDGEVANTVTDVVEEGHSIADMPYNLTIGQDFPSDQYVLEGGPDYVNFNDISSPEYHKIPAEWGGYFEGSVDEMRIYKTALTSTQVTSLYDREKP